MSWTAEIVRETTPDLNNPREFRAVRGDGNLLCYWTITPGSSLDVVDKPKLLAADGVWVEGEYEYQQLIDHEWVTTARFSVSTKWGRL